VREDFADLGGIALPMSIGYKRTSELPLGAGDVFHEAL